MSSSKDEDEEHLKNISDSVVVTTTANTGVAIRLAVESVKLVQPTLAAIQGRIIIKKEKEQENNASKVAHWFSPKEPCNVFVRKKSDINRLADFIVQVQVTAAAVEKNEEDESYDDERPHVAGQNLSTGRWVNVQDKCVQIQFLTPLTKRIERNRRGAKLLECEALLDLYTATTSYKFESPQIPYDNVPSSSDVPQEDPAIFRMHDKAQRHVLFAKWIVKMYGIKLLSKGAVLDVAGGKGDLSMALLDEGVPLVVLLDPEPRISWQQQQQTQKEDKENDKRKRIHVLAYALEDDGANLPIKEQEILMTCSMVVGMHPDQATEAIIDLAGRLKIPFALLPCCVMPSLFSKRIFQGLPVRSYRSFCQYLQSKQEDIQVDYLPFLGRNLILYNTPR